MTAAWDKKKTENRRHGGQGIGLWLVCHASSSPVPLKTRRVGERCMFTLSRFQLSSHWCDVVVKRGVPTQVSSTSLDYGLKLRGPSPKDQLSTIPSPTLVVFKLFQLTEPLELECVFVEPLELECVFVEPLELECVFVEPLELECVFRGTPRTRMCFLGTPRTRMCFRGTPTEPLELECVFVEPLELECVFVEPLELECVFVEPLPSFLSGTTAQGGP
ncbi:hypothetical protein TNCV_2728751 [Trichonephila clavipes]|nr:hypothetical protein TNCV_2728751 [Trichonephila clavipes]